MNKVHLIFCFVLSWFFIMVCIILHVFFVEGGLVAGDIAGFAIDSDENLYIGVHTKIIKIANDNDTQEDLLIPQTRHDYCFYIANDSIFIGNQREQTVGQYDLKGNYIEKSSLTYDEAKDRASYNAIDSEKGNKYELFDYHGFMPAEIKRNGETVYRMTTLDLLFSDMFFIVFLLIFGGCAAFFFIMLFRNPDIQMFIHRNRK